MVRRNTDTINFEERLNNKLKTVFLENECSTQWRPFKLSKGKKHYSPIVDVAIGPFAKERRHIIKYDELIGQNPDFFNALVELFKTNINSFTDEFPIEYLRPPRNFEAFLSSNACENANARCLLAIEIEKSGSRKHLLGDIINAGLLGRVGLIVAWDEKMLKAFIGMLAYFNFAKTVEKPSFSNKHVLIVTKKQLEDSLLNM